jgi:glycerol-3-phosphate dehydrogenase
MKPSGNTWYNWAGEGCAAEHRVSPATFSSETPYDVAIIGSGVIGCAIAYELSQYRLRVVVIDQAFDVGEGTSKANSAIIHTGFDAKPGSLESQLVTAASRQWPALAEKLKIPFRQTSALMLAFSTEQLSQLPKIRDKALANGVDDVRLVTGEEAKELEPQINANVLGGLLIPRESIADPFSTCIAYSDVAKANGVDMVFGVRIHAIEQPGSSFKYLAGSDGLGIHARFVINASGLGSRKLVESYGGELMDINPRRGQFLVYDRSSSHLVRHILLPIPTPKTKGMLVAPTVFGNLLAGPTAEDLAPDRIEATDTTTKGLNEVRQSAIRMCPSLEDEPVIATYAGLRCHCTQGSYWMRFNDGHTGIVTLSGIRSTGLTSSISTAQHVVRTMAEVCDLALVKNPEATDSRADSKWPGWWKRPFDDPQRLVECPDYGRMVCTCENISRAEIEEALYASPGVTTLDGLKRRTRVLAGRCQGFNCCVPIAVQISQHYEIPLSSVTKCGPGSEFIATFAEMPQGRRMSSLSGSTGNGPPEVKGRYRVIIIGAGPAGISAAIELSRRGVRDVLLVDRANRSGGVPAKYEPKSNGVPTFIAWNRGRVQFGKQLVDLLEQKLAATDTSVWLDSQVIDVDRAEKRITVVNPQLGKTDVYADAMVFACGAREKTPGLRRWIAGYRPARQFYTMQLLQLLDEHHVTPLHHAMILGSDLIAYSAAAKLSAAGADAPALFDGSPRNRANWLARLYFRRWVHPVWRRAEEVVVHGSKCVQHLEVSSGTFPCDGLVISGELVPNSELLSLAGLHMGRPEGVPVRGRNNELSEPGWFVTGAEAGGFHGADWSCRDGRRTGKSVAVFLSAKN